MSGETEYHFLKIKKSQFIACDRKDLKEFLQIIIKLILLEENHEDYEGDMHGFFGSSITDIRYICFRFHWSEKV